MPAIMIHFDSLLHKLVDNFGSAQPNTNALCRLCGCAFIRHHIDEKLEYPYVCPTTPELPSFFNDYDNETPSGQQYLDGFDDGDLV